MISTNLARHLRTHAKECHNQVVDTIKTDQIAYRKKTKVGRFIEEYIKTYKINPKSLRREYRLALQMTKNNVTCNGYTLENMTIKAYDLHKTKRKRDCSGK